MPSSIPATYFLASSIFRAFENTNAVKEPLKLAVKSELEYEIPEISEEKEVELISEERKDRTLRRRNFGQKPTVHPRTLIFRVGEKGAHNLLNFDKYKYFQIVF